MNVVFIAGLEIGRECVKSVVDGGWDVVGVFTLSEKFRDRSGYVDFSDLKKAGVPLFEVDDVNLPENVERIRRLKPDVVFVIGWSFMVGDEIIKIPKKGCIGHHPSLLPRHRGNAPIPWALITGLTRSGVTLLHLVDKVDAGDIVGQKGFVIDFLDYADDVYRKVVNATVELYAEVLPKLRDGTCPRLRQDDRRADVMPQRKPQDGLIDWDRMPLCQYNWIRGLSHPYPGAFTYLGEEKVYVWRARFLEDNLYKGVAYSSDVGGRVLDVAGEGLIVSSGGGALLLSRLQRDGADEMDGAEFARMFKLKKGDVFG